MYLHEEVGRENNILYLQCIIMQATIIYMCHTHGKWVRKEMKRFEAFVVFGVLAWTPTDMQTNHGSSNAHVHQFSCWKIRADDHDIMI